MRAQDHPYHLAIGLALGLHLGIAVPVHGRRNVGMTHQLLLDPYGRPGLVQPGTIRVTERVPAYVSQLPCFGQFPPVCVTCDFNPFFPTMDALLCQALGALDETPAGRAQMTLLNRRSMVGIPFLSAMSMLGARDQEPRSYLEMVDALRQHGASPKEDIEALWRRIVFNILISNTDDHLRNHGFLYEGQAGWRLSPAYDLNPMPIDLKPRILSTMITEDDSTASLDLAMDVAGYFQLDASRAKAIASEVAHSVATWRNQAARAGLSKTEIDRMASAFEHEDLKKGLGK
jgi:hypothetical protein